MAVNSKLEFGITFMNCFEAEIPEHNCDFCLPSDNIHYSEAQHFN